MLRALTSMFNGARAPGRRGALLSRAACWMLCGAMMLLVAGCSFTTHQSTLDPKGPVARDQLELFYITVWVTAFIFVTVGGAMAYAVWKYREKPGDENKPMPEQGHGNPVVEIGLIAASIALLVIIAIPTLKSIWFTMEMPVNEPFYQESLLGKYYPDAPAEAKDEVLEITVYGLQWWFNFDYKQLGFTSGNEFVIPEGKVVLFNLRARDVIHSFWLPKLGGKVDVIPGRHNHLWLLADPVAEAQKSAEELKRGILFYGQCAEFCGEAHAYMLFRARSVTPAQFAEWVSEQKRPVLPPGADQAWGAAALQAAAAKDPKSVATDADRATVLWTAFREFAGSPGANLSAEQRGAKLFFGSATCVQCHAITGSPAAGVLGPNLSHVASRTSLAAGILDNMAESGAIEPGKQRENLVNWIAHSQRYKPGNKMYYGQGVSAGLINLKYQGITLSRLAQVNLGMPQVQALDLTAEQREKLAATPDPSLSEILTVAQLKKLTQSLTDDQFAQISHWPSHQDFEDIAAYMQTLH